MLLLHTATMISGWVGAAIAVAGALTLGWAIFRAQALNAWRAAAEGYKAQVEEMTPRLENAERLAVSLQAQIVELERRPDMREVMGAISDLSDELRAGLSDMRERLGRPGGG